LSKLLLNGFGGTLSESDRASKVYQSLTDQRPVRPLVSKRLCFSLSLPWNNTQDENEDKDLVEALQLQTQDGDVLALVELRDEHPLAYRTAMARLPTFGLKHWEEAPQDMPRDFGDLEGLIPWPVETNLLREIVYEAARTGNNDLVLKAVGHPGLAPHLHVDMRIGPHQSTLLLAAARAGNRQLCQELMQRFRANPLVSSASGDIPLHWLARFEPCFSRDSEEDKVKKLVKIAKAFMGRGDMAGGEGACRHPLRQWARPPLIPLLNGMPLHFAIAHNSTAAVKALLDEGVGANPWDRYAGAELEQDCPYRSPDFSLTAFTLAVRLNAWESLGAIATHPRWQSSGDAAQRSACRCHAGDLSAQHGVSYVLEALQCGFRVDRMRLHGASYQHAMKNTIDILHKMGVRMVGIMRGSLGHQTDIFTVAAWWRYPWLIGHLVRQPSSYPCLQVASSKALTRRPLWRAIYMGDTEVFEALYLHSGIGVLNGWPNGGAPFHVPCLHLCASAGHQNIALAQSMLDKGADLELTDSLDRTALVVAVISGFFKMADLLLLLGAKINPVVHPDRVTPLGRMIQHPALSIGRITYLFGRAQAESTATIAQAWPHLERNIFHLLASSDPQHWFPDRVVLIFQKVLELKPGLASPTLINQVDRLGFTPLMLAVFHSHLALVEALLRLPNGIEVHNVPKTISNPITIATLMQRATERICSTHKGSRMGRLASRSLERRVRIVELLQEKGAPLEYNFLGLPQESVTRFFKGFNVSVSAKR
jgi:ankyrin repeat protein